MSQVVENELQVGDLVRVIAAHSELHGSEGYIAKTDFGAPPNVYLFESDDKQHRCWFAVDSLRKLRDSWVLEPPADHIADADKMVSPAIPAGWRELHEGESRSQTDLFDFEGEWVSYETYNPAGSEFPKYDKRIHRQHIRKIEQSPGHVEGVWLEEADPYASRKIEQPANEPETQYREPTNDDFGAMVEVRDCVSCEWIELEFVCVLPPGDWRFCCENEYGGRAVWRFARIKAEQLQPAPKSYHNADGTLRIKSQTRDVENLLSDAEVINATSINFEPKRPLVYIAGPMRGIPHFNFPAFDAAKEYLIGKGYDVLSPADFDRELDGFDPYKPEYETAEGCAEFPGEMDFKRVVTRDLTAVTQCDAVALLSGWEKSKGAVAEIAVAHWMGKPVMHLLCDANRPNEVVFDVREASTTLEQFVLRLAHAHDAYDKRINCAIDPPPPELNLDCDILEVAASITRGDRQAVYGPPDQDFKKTADMWTGMFQYMLAPGAKFEPRHVAMAMICIKLSREFHQRKRDNWIDIAGYARCGSLCSS